METLDVEKANGAAWNIARKVGEKYPDSTVDDLSQEVWLWIVENQAEILTWEEEDWVRRLYRRGYRVANAAARRDRARYLGYEPRDEYFYSLTSLRKWLPFYYADGLDPEDQIMLDRDFKLDLDLALPDLDGETCALLRFVYDGDDPEGRTAALAASEGIEVGSARKRVQRALGRLREALGGPSPYEHEGRQAMSNAKALTMTGRDYGAY